MPGPVPHAPLPRNAAPLPDPDPLWLERSTADRTGRAVLALLLLGVAPAVLLSRAPLGVLTTALSLTAAALAALALAARAFRASVFAYGGEVRVRGYLWTRRIAVRDVVGVDFDTVYWCGRRGRLRRTRLAVISPPAQRFPGGPESGYAALERRRLAEWSERAVGARIRRRARLVGSLDGAALAREALVARAGLRWEARRRRFGAAPRARWGVLADAVARERAARGVSPGSVSRRRGPGSRSR